MIEICTSYISQRNLKLHKNVIVGINLRIVGAIGSTLPVDKMRSVVSVKWVALIQVG